MRKVKKIFLVAIGDIIRKAKVFWVFKLISSKNILHTVAQSPNLIHYSHLKFFMREGFGGGTWRSLFSNKSYPHHYATQQHYFKYTHPHTSPHSSQKTIGIISSTLLGRMHPYPKLFPQYIPLFNFGTTITTKLNHRYCEIRTQALSQNPALSKGINGVVAFTCYLIH